MTSWLKDSHRVVDRLRMVQPLWGEPPLLTNEDRDALLALRPPPTFLALRLVRAENLARLARWLTVPTLLTPIVVSLAFMAGGTWGLVSLCACALFPFFWLFGLWGSRSLRRREPVAQLCGTISKQQHSGATSPGRGSSTGTRYWLFVGDSVVWTEHRVWTEVESGRPYRLIFSGSAERKPGAELLWIEPL